MRTSTNDKVLDFYTAFIAVPLLVAQGITVVAGYLKNYDPAYVAKLHAAEIGFVPIAEFGAETALEGAASGAAKGRLAVAQAQRGGIAAGTTIIATHDTSAFTAAVPQFFKAEHDVIRAAGFGFGGYFSKQVVDACRAAGCTIDLIWAPAAYAWGGGRHPDAHVWQKPSSVFPGLGPSMRVDFGTVMRPFDAWLPVVDPPGPVHPPTPPTPIPLEDDTMASNIVTNSEQFLASAPGVAKFLVKNDGSLRHLTYTEWVARGSDQGVPLTTAQILELGAS